MTSFEMANGDKPEEIVLATQRALCSSMRKIMAEMRKDVGGPGLTWEQIEYFIQEFEKRQPRIIMQEGPI